jgi:hypothetical protein
MNNSKPTIPIQEFNKGGLADSKWSGVTNSFYKMTGVDPHSSPGLLKVAQKMTKMSGTTVDEYCKERVVSSNGRIYFFSSDSGKIWEIDTAGSITLVLTTTAAAGEVKCLGACEYQGYIYWATESRLHRILASDAEGAAEWAANKALNWATFSKTDKLFHPMYINTGNQVLYIGDANVVAQVDAGTFSDEALDLQIPYRVKSLGQISTDLLVGTWVSDTVTQTQIFRWNTWSVSFTSSDTIPEVGINAFIPTDNFVIVQAGLAGNLYSYDGSVLKLYKKFPGEYSVTKYGSVNPSAVGNLNGEILMGFSNGSGNPADCGTYRLSRYDSKYPLILDFPYPISERASAELVTTNVEIGAIAVSGFNVYISWKRTIPGDTPTYTYGIDKLDYSNKLEKAYIETRVMHIQREEFSTVDSVVFAYNEIPASCDLDIYLSKNYGAYALMDHDLDTDRLTITGDQGDEVTTLQVKLTFTVSSNTAPSIESGAVFVK